MRRILFLLVAILTFVASAHAQSSTPLTITDGTVSKTSPRRLVFPSGTLTISGSTVTYSGEGGGGGDVVGPASATDLAVARYDGTTGKLLQNSGVTVDGDNKTVVSATSTSTSTSHRALYGLLTSNPATNSSARLFGIRAESNTQIGGNNVNYNTVGALDVDVAFNSTGTATALESYSGTTYNASGSAITTLDGIKQFLQSDTGTVTKSRGFFYGFDINGGTVTTAYGAYLSNPAGSGSITNNYGLYVENMAKGGTLNRSVYVAGGTVEFVGPAVFGNTVTVSGTAQFRATLAVFTPLSNQPPAATFATLDTRNAQAVLVYDADTDWDAIFSGTLPTYYGGNGISVTIEWAAAAATTGNIVWNAQFERQQDGTDTIASDSFATAQTATCAAPGTAGIVQYCTITFSNSQIDGLLLNEGFRIKVTRDANNAADTMTGNAQLVKVWLRETP